MFENTLDKDTKVQEIENGDGEVTGYVVNDSNYLYLPLGGTHLDIALIEWLKENTPLPAYTDEERVKILKAQYERYYKELVDNKLEELDYDNLERLSGYACRPASKYVEESNNILDWHESIVEKNYAILNDITKGIKHNDTWKDIIPTKEEYLAELPEYVGV